VTKEQVTCELELEVRDINNPTEVKKIKTRADLEIDFDGKEGKSASELGQVVKFERAEKEYNIIVKVDKARKDAFKYHIVSYQFKPAANETFEILNQN
jgi:hypothetical protein